MGGGLHGSRVGGGLHGSVGASLIIDCDCGLHRFDLVFMLALMMQIESTVGEVMSSPAITLTPDKTVLGNLLTIGTHESL